jgi:hypothetical protein
MQMMMERNGRERQWRKFELRCEQRHNERQKYEENESWDEKNVDLDMNKTCLEMEFTGFYS